HDCVVFDRDPNAVQRLLTQGVTGVDNLTGLISKLNRPRAVWVMLPAGGPTEETVRELGSLLETGDMVIDGGNSFYKDDIRRARQLKEKGVRYVDCGTSGGIWGLERGYCLMIGGEKSAVEHLDPIFAALAPGTDDIPDTPGRDKRDPRVERGYM